MDTAVHKKTTGSKEVQPTAMQKQTFEYMVANGGNMSDAMRKSGYSEAMTHNPQKLKSSSAWKQMEDKYFPEELLAKIHSEGLQATKIVKKLVETEVPDENGNIKKVIKNTLVEVPDHNVRHRFLDMAYKVRGMYPKETNIDVNVAPFSLADLAYKHTKRKELGLKPVTID